MSGKAVFAIFLAVFVPVLSYLIVKNASDDAISMPLRYYPDSVSTFLKNGKQMTDTVWHRVKNIDLINQNNELVSLDNLRGKVIVVDYFFTHCPSICPALQHNMKGLQDGLKLKDEIKNIDSPFVHFISFTVDPERDSASVLRKYGERFGVNPDLWWLLTGPKKKIYDFALDELKMGLQDGEGVDSNFIHTQKMVLLDKDHVVRGYYDGLDSVSLAKLANDIVFIMLEKDKKAPSVFIELKPLIPIIAIILVMTAAGVVYFSRKQKLEI